MCKSGALRKFLDLGSMPPADQFRTAAQLQQPVTSYPLEVFSCLDCGLAQLGYVVPPQVLYQDDYPYESSTTLAGRVHWAEFAKTTVDLLGLGSADLVVDVGSNVGTLLDAFQANGTRILGVDPAWNIAGIANSRGIETIADFFGVPAVTQILARAGQASAVTAANVFAHVDDLDGFMEAISLLLRHEGSLIIEAPYFLRLIENLEYDTIYHEHLSYLSIRPLGRFLERHGFRIFNVESQDIHGGSLRIFASRAGTKPVSPVVGQMIEIEEASGLYSAGTLDRFAAAVLANREQLVWLLHKLRHDGERIAAVSAPAKGMTLLNFCRIGPETLDFVTEKAALKIGRFTPGTSIPVVADEELLHARPPYALLLAWNFAEEIMANLRPYAERGGKFILPIPEPRIIG